MSECPQCGTAATYQLGENSFGCKCTYEAEVMLDPKTLTPESLYKLQSETWAQGAEAEQQRIIKLLEPLTEHEDYCKDGCYPEDCSAPSYQYAIDLIKGEYE